jgi:hypothetical protein
MRLPDGSRIDAAARPRVVDTYGVAIALRRHEADVERQGGLGRRGPTIHPPRLEGPAMDLPFQRFAHGRRKFVVVLQLHHLAVRTQRYLPVMREMQGRVG